MQRPEDLERRIRGLVAPSASTSWAPRAGTPRPSGTSRKKGSGPSAAPARFAPGARA